MHILVTKYTYDHMPINSTRKNECRGKFNIYYEQIRALYFQHYQLKEYYEAIIRTFVYFKSIARYG